MENNEEYQKQLKAELEQAKAEAAAARAAAEKAKSEAEAAKQVLAARGVASVEGEYRGYRFDTSHTRFRSGNGSICDSQKVLNAANAGDTEAQALLDRLIKIGYAYFRPVPDAEAPVEPEGKKKK